MTTRLLLTGASGFLGSVAAPLFADTGVTLITTDLHGDVDYVGDLADPAFTATLPDVDVVVHAAAVQYVTRSIPFWRRKPWFHRNNVVATTNLASRYSGRVRYFLQVGTSMMYDQNLPGPYGPDSPLKGAGVYSESKLESVRIAEAMGNPVGVMVPCIIGGPGREGLFPRFVQTMTRFGLAVVPGSGRHATQMVHVQDAAALLVAMVGAESPGLHNAAGPDALTIRDWIRIIGDELGLSGVRVLSIPYPLVKAGAALTRYRFIAREQSLMLGQPHVLDITRSQSLGWSPAFDNERIVRAIARYCAGSADEA